MEKIALLEKEIQTIKQRNKKVEGNKAWETSFFRRAVISLGTYVFAVIFLLMINAPDPIFTAFVPAFAYIISTLTLPALKEIWLKSEK